MTIEQLEKANKIHEELKEKKEFLKAFDSPYGNVIRANDYDGHREKTRLLFLYRYNELSNLIREYIVNQIVELEKQLEEL